MYPVRLLIFAVLPVFPRSAVAEAASITTPAPVSGRNLARPDSITAADALARLTLVRDNLELIRMHMGRYPAPEPLARADRASVVDAYYRGINLRRRLARLVYEQLRVDAEWRVLPGNTVRPFEVFGLMDGALVQVLRVKQSLGIDQSIAEHVQQDQTTATDLFNALAETGALVNVLLDKKTEARDAFRIATLVAHMASQLHVALTRRLMPHEPELVHNKTPEDVFAEVKACSELVTRLAETFDVSPLRLTIADPRSDRPVSPDDVMDLLVLMLAELNRIMDKAGVTREQRDHVAPGRKFPSHVYQRTLFIKALVRELIEVRTSRRR